MKLGMMLAKVQSAVDWYVIKGRMVIKESFSSLLHTDSGDGTDLGGYIDDMFTDSAPEGDDGMLGGVMSAMSELGSAIYWIIAGASFICGVVMLAFGGLKSILGGSEGKREFKDIIVAVIIGLFFVIGAVNIIIAIASTGASVSATLREGI